MAKNRPDKSANLDGLIARDDFFEESGDQAETNEIRVTDLEPGITFNRLRKPDFQRETSNWTPAQIVDLIETFCAGDIIPSIILWESGARIFVIDGAHRLSALIGWINSDFGDGELSRRLYAGRVSEHQRLMHEQTIALLEKSVGSWEKYKVERPSWSLKTLQVQWIKGRTAKQAAKAFVRINQGGTEIDQLEVRILHAARSALSVATRAIVRGGTGHQYWKHFAGEEAKSGVPSLGKDIHALMYEPTLRLPIKTVELPLAGASHGPHALRLAFDLVAVANGLSVPDSTRGALPKEPLPDDEEGNDTLNYLRRTKRVIQMVLSNEPHSYGLHPALWFYNASGVFQPAALLNVVTWLLALDKQGRGHTFRRLRGRFEDLILEHPTIIKPSVNKLGSGARTRKTMISVLDKTLALLEKHTDNAAVWSELCAEFKSLKREEEEHEEARGRGTLGGAFDLSVKNATTLADLASVPRCKLCGGLKHPNGITLDHTVKRADGGLSSVHNSRWVHPICNGSRDMDEKPSQVPEAARSGGLS